ncbi:hypothetical protein ACFQL0_03330 [Haloplanus litoreus]|uniref:hypothetical protein n=1 Tax=Haloplanus litoreus TaxID=767515 RepID=UPI00360ABAE9
MWAALAELPLRDDGLAVGRRLLGVGAQTDLLFRPGLLRCEGLPHDLVVDLVDLDRLEEVGVDGGVRALLARRLLGSDLPNEVTEGASSTPGPGSAPSSPSSLTVLLPTVDTRLGAEEVRGVVEAVRRRLGAVGQRGAIPGRQGRTPEEPGGGSKST